MMRLARSLWRNADGAIAPLVALSLTALIAVGGVAFDYARLATMDTELQQAADQAALAAATQLDEADDAQTRAATVIQDPTDSHRLASNITRFANDGSGSGVTIDSIKFCSAFNDATADTDAACTETNDGQDSKFVIVTTEIRTADYALTPIVAAFSGSSHASAVAGVASSICNVAPLLVCAPTEDFPTDADIGKGIVMKVAGGNSWAPGNYGFLDFGNGNPAVLAALLNNGLNGCQATGETQTEPGNKNATDAINTRMDVYAGLNKNDASNCDPTTGAACPAQDTRKDMTQQMTYTIRQSTQPTTSPNCGAAAGGKPQDATGQVQYDAFAQNGGAKQFGRDTCHYDNTCPVTGGAKNFGNGTWDRAGFIAANHPTETASTIAAAIGGAATATTLTRYQVYQWEIANKDNAKKALDNQTISTGAWSQQGQNWSITKQCAFNTPRFAAAASNSVKDRRVLPVVAADCTNLKGKGQAFVDFRILRVFDVFLTEPSLQRSALQTGIGGATLGTDDKEIYGEVIGPAQAVGGTNGFQYFARNKPYLVR
jgi:Flp pilus assembly protein TadG